MGATRFDKAAASAATAVTLALLVPIGLSLYQSYEAARADPEMRLGLPEFSWRLVVFTSAVVSNNGALYLALAVLASSLLVARVAPVMTSRWRRSRALGLTLAWIASVLLGMLVPGLYLSTLVRPQADADDYFAGWDLLGYVAVGSICLPVLIAALAFIRAAWRGEPVIWPRSEDALVPDDTAMAVHEASTPPMLPERGLAQRPQPPKPARPTTASQISPDGSSRAGYSEFDWR